MSIRTSSKGEAQMLGNRKIYGENIKCTLIGDKYVGKTSMLLSYQTDTYPSHYVPTTLDTYSKSITYHGKVINLQLYDIGGKEDLGNFEEQGRIGTDVFLLCFSLDSRDSFTSTSTKWIEQIQQYWLSSMSSNDKAGTRDTTGKEYQPIIILVGCKNDKCNVSPLLSEIRRHRPSRKNDPRNSLDSMSLVTSKEAIRLKQRIGAYLYTECSARNGTGITETFNAAINAVLQRRSYTTPIRYI